LLVEYGVCLVFVTSKFHEFLAASTIPFLLAVRNTVAFSALIEGILEFMLQAHIVK